MNFMFSGASNLTNLDVSNWNTNKVTYMSGVFEETGLTSLDISNWNTVNVTNISSMFSGANKLKELKLGENFKNTGDTYNLFKYLDNHSYRNIYTNKWVKKDGSAGPFTVNEWNTAYRNNSARMSGTWVRENYRPPKGANITVKYLAGTTEVATPLVLEGNLNERIPTVNKPEIIRKNGKAYKLSTNNIDFSNTRFTNNIQLFIVKYDEVAASDYVYKKIVNRNGVLETLGDPTVIYREGDKVGTSYNLTTPETFTLNGKKYKIKNIVDKNISGQVKGAEVTPVKNIEYNEIISSSVNYQPVLNNSPLGTSKVIANTDTVVGGNYNVVPEEIVVNGIKYVPKNNRPLTGVIDSGRTINVEYEEKQGNTEISYQPKFNGNNLGNSISVKNQITNRREGATFEVSPNNEITVDNKVYKLKTPTEKVRGTITQSPQTKEIEYVVKNSTNATTYQPKLNGNNLGNTIEITPITQVGTSYNVVPKDIIVDGKVYEPVSKNALTGRTSENNTPVSVNYQPKLSTNALNYQPKLNGTPIGNLVELVPSNSQIGTPYNVVPKDIILNGKVYEAISKNALTGRTTPTNTPLEVEYRAKTKVVKYQPKLNESNLGNVISSNEEVQIGESYTIVPEKINLNNRVYVPIENNVRITVEDNENVKEINYKEKVLDRDVSFLAIERKNNTEHMITGVQDNVLISQGTPIGSIYRYTPKNIIADGRVYEPVDREEKVITVADPNEEYETFKIEYIAKRGNTEISYQPKFNGNNLGTPISIKEEILRPIVNETEEELSQEGTTFEVSPRSEVTVDNKVYKLKTPTDKVSGRITQSQQTKEIEYVAKNSNNNLVYQPKFNGNNLGNNVKITPITQIGTPYNIVPKDITVDGKVYEPVSTNSLTGRVAENNTPLEVNYQPKLSTNTLNYQPKVNGQPIGTPIEVVSSNSQVGTPYNVVPKDIIVNGKVYEPVVKDNLTGRTTDANTPIEVEYRAKQGNSEISYQPKFNGNNLGTPVLVKDQITDKQEGANFEVSPNDEITVDNKVYKLKTPTDKVSGTITQSPQTKEIEYVEKNSSNGTSYQPKFNNTNLGTPIEITSITQVGTSYNVVPKDITIDGKVYEPVSKDALTGRTTEINTSLEVEYRAKQGNDEISYQPKFNGSDLGIPVSVKDQITDKQEGANFEISPNNEITIDNKVYKLKTPTDKVSGTITQSPQTKEIEYVAKDSNNNLVYQPKLSGNDLGTPIEITPVAQIGTPYNVIPKDITVDGKVYETVSKDALTGRVLENNTPIEVNYQPKLSSNILNYQPKVNGQAIGNPIEIVPSNSQIGTSYEITPKEITIDGKVYESVSKDSLTGRTTEDNTPIEVEYRAKQGNSEISYQPKVNGQVIGAPISVKEQITDKQEGAKFKITPNSEITIDNKVYKLKNTTDKVSGTITQSPQVKEIEYVAKNSNNNLVYQPKFNNTNLGNPVEITPITQVGTPYNVVPKDITVDGKVYEPISKNVLTGRVSENNTPIEVSYQPKLSNNTLNYQPKVNGTPIGKPIELVPSNSQVGTSYEIVPKDITINGKVYEPVVKNNLTGKTTEENTTIEVEYRAKQGNDEINYQPKFNGNNLGTPISVKEQITDKQEGATFEISPNNEITIDNKVYKLKNDTDKVSGTITQSSQTKEIEYVVKNSNNNLGYQPKLNGNNLGDSIEITPITQVGTSYNVIPKDITVDGKVYESISKEALTGRVLENNTPIEVNYQPKLSNKALSYQPKVNGTPIGNPIEIIPNNSQIGTPYEITPQEITIDGKVYEPVVKNNLTGRTTEENTPIEVEYRVKQGNTEISYQPKFNGNNLGTPISVKEQITDKQEGANFEITPNNEITIDNKVYKLKNSVDKVRGTITQSPQVKEIEYVAKNSNNNLVYQPKVNGDNLGTPIEISPIAQIGTSYETAPKEITVDGKVYEPISKNVLTGRVSENNTPIEVSYQPKLSNNTLNYQPKVNGTPIGKPIELVPSNSQVGTPYTVLPKEITVDGKVYEPISKNALTGRVSENNSPIEVNYQPKLSNKALNYQPKVNGENTGTPIEVVPSNSQIGTPYEITPKDITVNGRVYEPVSKDTLTGRTTEANTPIEVEYRAKQGNDEISYQPKVNNENLGTPISVKEQITDKQEGANFEISPNNEITVDNKVYKLKNSADKVSGTITQSPQVKEIEYIAKNSNNNLGYQPKFNGANLGDSIEIVPISQVGTPYIVIPKEITIAGKVYEPVSKEAITGRVSENNSPIEVNYQPKLNSKALEYQPKVNGKELRKPIEILPTNSQVGTSYNVIPKKLLIDGKLYTPVNKDTLTGNLLENNGTINIEYKEAKDYNDTFKQFKEIEKDVVYVSADKDKKEAYDKELKVLSNLLKGEKDPSDIEKSIANLNKLKEALNGKVNLLKAVEKAKEEISKLTYIIPQADPILDMLDEPSMIDIEVITNIVEDAKELNNTVKEIVKVLDKHNEKEIDYKKATPEKKEEYNKKAKEILEALKDKTLNKEKALEKAKELNKVSENLDGIENKQKQDAIISEIEKNTNLPKEVKEKLVETIENTTSSDELNNLLDKGKTIDKEIKDNKKLIEENQGSNLSDKEKEDYNKALKELIDVLSNPKSTKEEISKAKEKLSTIKDKVEESNNIKELEKILSNSDKEMNLSKAKELLEKISSKLDENDNNSKELKAILSKTELTKEDFLKAKELLTKVQSDKGISPDTEKTFTLEYKDKNNKVIKTFVFPNSKKEDIDLLYPKELTSDNGEKYIRNSDNTYSLIENNSKPLDKPEEKPNNNKDNNSVIKETNKDNGKSVSDDSNVNKETKDNNSSITKKEELPKTSSSMLSVVGLFSIFGLRKNRKKDKQ